MRVLDKILVGIIIVTIMAILGLAMWGSVGSKPQELHGEDLTGVTSAEQPGGEPIVFKTREESKDVPQEPKPEVEVLEPVRPLPTEEIAAEEGVMALTCRFEKRSFVAFGAPKGYVLKILCAAVNLPGAGEAGRRFSIQGSDGKELETFEAPQPSFATERSIFEKPFRTPVSVPGGSWFQIRAANTPKQPYKVVLVCDLLKTP